MKHISKVTLTVPAKAAFCGEDHPNFQDSISGFLEDPLGVIQDHLKKVQPA